MDEELRETPLDSRVIHRGRLLALRDDIVRLANGAQASREVVEHPGAVAVVAIDDAGRVVLVRQWRHAVGRATWELPAGTRDVEGESPLETAKRELEEETGFLAGAWRDLGSAPLTPGYSTELMHYFAAADLTPSTPHLDDDELVRVGQFTGDELSALVREGQLDTKTIAGLALAGRPVTHA
ncbi:MAG: NUDIX hydrolase [Candidatus Dormibacteraeota bacterium]|nr:NUDIX hydrolase [Candidatus Dormibacteraeota bacterium]